MENINPDDYNHIYQINYAYLMIKILEPYIKFMLKSDGSELEIYHLNYKANQYNEPHLIDIKQYIRFIQYDFPEIIQAIKHFIEKEIEEEENEALEFSTKIYPNGPNRIKIKPPEMSQEEYDKKIKYYDGEYKTEKIGSKIYTSKNYKEISEYEKKISSLQVKITNLNKINELNITNNSKIKDIIEFLDILKNYYIFE